MHFTWHTHAQMQKFNLSTLLMSARIGLAMRRTWAALIPNMPKGNEDGVQSEQGQKSPKMWYILESALENMLLTRQTTGEATKTKTVVPGDSMIFGGEDPYQSHFSYPFNSAAIQLLYGHSEASWKRAVRSSIHIRRNNLLRFIQVAYTEWAQKKLHAAWNVWNYVCVWCVLMSLCVVMNRR